MVFLMIVQPLVRRPKLNASQCGRSDWYRGSSRSEYQPMRHGYTSYGPTQMSSLFWTNLTMRPKDLTALDHAHPKTWYVVLVWLNAVRRAGDPPRYCRSLDAANFHRPIHFWATRLLHAN